MSIFISIVSDKIHPIIYSMNLASSEVVLVWLLPLLIILFFDVILIVT
jgi:hypothetical protein